MYRLLIKIKLRNLLIKIKLRNYILIQKIIPDRILRDFEILIMGDKKLINGGYNLYRI